MLVLTYDLYQFGECSALSWHALPIRLSDEMPSLLVACATGQIRTDTGLLLRQLQSAICATVAYLPRSNTHEGFTRMDSLALDSSDDLPTPL
jgi:hypothetical protein